MIVTLRLKLADRRETLSVSLPDGASAADALAAADIPAEDIFIVRATRLIAPQDLLADGDVLTVLPVMLGG